MRHDSNDEYVAAFYAEVKELRGADATTAEAYFSTRLGGTPHAEGARDNDRWAVRVELNRSDRDVSMYRSGRLRGVNVGVPLRMSFIRDLASELESLGFDRGDIDDGWFRFSTHDKQFSMRRAVRFPWS